MTPEEIAELDRLFTEAVGLDPAARAQFVDRIRASAPDTARHLVELLDADEAVTRSIPGVVEATARTLLPTEEALLGERFGPYRVERLLGRGGMGAVYLGHRVDGDFEQMAAIKTVRYGLESPHLLERFRRERDILAQLNHPGIARLLDGGSGPHGLPFVAMEYVDGVPLLDHVQQNHCDLRRRLELFIEICEAIAFVHRNSVIHRDIKPSNVLVATDGRIKLLDFGIAKLSDAFDFSGLTRTEQRPMTPEYASPEQILNRPVTTASDVYSLGVLLYELLTEVRPTDLDSKDTYTLSRAIVEQTPSLPSDLVKGKTRPASRVVRSRPWHRQLRGDLDRITMMALRKEPERRYSSAAALADDVRRYLDGHPVSAQEDVWHYRLRKFVRRNPVVSGVAAVFLLTVVGFSIATLEQNRRVRAQRDRAVEAEVRTKATSDFLARLLMTADPRSIGTRTMTVMDVVTAGLEELEQADDLDPAARIELHMVLAFTLSNLDQHEPGLRSMERALALSTAEYGAHSLQTAEVEHRLGDLYRQVDRFDEAYELLTRALETRLALSDEKSHMIADSYNNLSILTIAMGRYREADELEAACIEMHAEVAGDADATELATPLNNMAILKRRQGRLDESLALTQRSHAIAIHLEDQATALYAQVTSTMTLIEMGRLDEAEQVLRDVRPRQLELTEQGHTRMLLIDRLLAEILRARGRYDEAEAAFSELAAIAREDKGEASTGFARVQHAWGRLDRDRGRTESAVRRLRLALELNERFTGPRHYRQPLFRADLARALNDADRFAEAEPLLRQAIAALPTPADYPYVRRAEALIELARTLRRTKREDEAADTLAEAERVIAATTGPDSLPAGRLRLEQGALRLARGEPEAAAEAFRIATTILSARLPATHVDRRRLQRWLETDGG